MELGGNIVLEGFSEDSADLIVLKKVIGNFAKEVAGDQELGQLKLTHSLAGEDHSISGTLILAGETYDAENVGKNLFFCLDAVLKDLRTAVP